MHATPTIDARAGAGTSGVARARRARRAVRALAVLLLSVAPIAAHAQGGEGAAPGPTVRVAHDERYGDYLTDGTGRTLYLFVKTSQQGWQPAYGRPRMTSGVRARAKACDARCLAAWPPFTAGSVRAGPGVDPDLVYVAQVAGRRQVTVDGWPLYFFLGDEEPGAIGGQAVDPPGATAFGGSWFLVAPDGTPITTRPPRK